MKESVSQEIVELVAASEDIDPLELPPLSETIDPDALDRLFRNTSGRLTFEYQSHTVTVEGNGGVEVVSVD
jgi:hypothetical protein